MNPKETKGKLIFFLGNKQWDIPNLGEENISKTRYKHERNTAMIANIKFSIITTCLVLAFLVMPLNGFAAINIYRSPALQTIFNQAEATYTKRFVKGMTNQIALNTAPELFAMSVGMTLQRQFKHLRNNRNYVSHYEALEKEALNFVYQLAKAHNYRHPTDGSSLPEGRVGVAFYQGLNGKMNAMMIQKTGIDPAKARLPFMLAQVSVPQTTGGNNDWAGGPQVKNNEISFFGKVAPAAKSAQVFNDKKIPSQQTQSAPATPLTGGDSAKFTIKPDNSNTASIGYYDINLRFDRKATIYPHITKVVVTYNNQLQRKMNKAGSWSSWNEFSDHFKPSNFSLRQPYYLAFEAYNAQGKVICRGKTHYQYKAKKKKRY